MKVESNGLTLLDYLGWRMGCICLSDLHGLNRAQRMRLADEIKKIPASGVSLDEWNDALQYLIGGPPSPARDDARAKLVKGLETQSGEGTAKG